MTWFGLVIWGWPSEVLPRVLGKDLRQEQWEVQVLLVLAYVAR